jgi:hypothetical protein
MRPRRAKGRGEPHPPPPAVLGIDIYGMRDTLAKPASGDTIDHEQRGQARSLS